MSKQYLKQIQALEGANYTSAYAALMSYCTGKGSFFNPKRRVILRALRTVHPDANTSYVINTVIAFEPSILDINPATKLAAVFYVINRNEKNLDETTTRVSVQNIIKLDEARKEETLIKLLQRYSALWIVRLFTGELGNAHVKEVRALLKQYRDQELSYDDLLHNITEMEITDGDVLSELAPIMEVNAAEDLPEEEEQNDSHSSSTTTSKNTEENRAREQEESEERRLENEKIRLNALVEQKKLLKEWMQQYSDYLSMPYQLLGLTEAQYREETALRDELVDRNTDDYLATLSVDDLDQEVILIRNRVVNTLENQHRQIMGIIEKRRTLIRGFDTTLKGLLENFKKKDFRTDLPISKVLPSHIERITALLKKTEQFLSLDDVDCYNMSKAEFEIFTEECDQELKKTGDFIIKHKKAIEEEHARQAKLTIIKKKTEQMKSELGKLHDLLESFFSLASISEAERLVGKQKHERFLLRLKDFDNDAIKNLELVRLNAIEIESDSLKSEISQMIQSLQADIEKIKKILEGKARFEEQVRAEEEERSKALEEKKKTLKALVRRQKEYLDVLSQYIEAAKPLDENQYAACIQEIEQCNALAVIDGQIKTLEKLIDTLKTSYDGVLGTIKGGKESLAEYKKLLASYINFYSEKEFLDTIALCKEVSSQASSNLNRLKLLDQRITQCLAMNDVEFYKTFKAIQVEFLKEPETQSSFRLQYKKACTDELLHMISMKFEAVNELRRVVKSMTEKFDLKITISLKLIELDPKMNRNNPKQLTGSSITKLNSCYKDMQNIEREAQSLELECFDDCLCKDKENISLLKQVCFKSGFDKDKLIQNIDALLSQLSNLRRQFTIDPEKKHELIRNINSQLAENNKCITESKSFLDKYTAIKKNVDALTAGRALETVTELLDNSCLLLGITEEKRLEKKQLLNTLRDTLSQFTPEAVKNLSLVELTALGEKISRIDTELKKIRVDDSGCDLKNNVDKNKKILDDKLKDLKYVECRLAEEIKYLTDNNVPFLAALVIPESISRLTALKAEVSSFCSANVEQLLNCGAKIDETMQTVQAERNAFATLRKAIIAELARYSDASEVFNDSRLAVKSTSALIPLDQKSDTATKERLSIRGAELNQKGEDTICGVETQELFDSFPVLVKEYNIFLEKELAALPDLYLHLGIVKYLANVIYQDLKMANPQYFISSIIQSQPYYNIDQYTPNELILTFNRFAKETGILFNLTLLRVLLMAPKGPSNPPLDIIYLYVEDGHDAAAKAAARRAQLEEEERNNQAEQKRREQLLKVYLQQQLINAALNMAKNTYYRHSFTDAQLLEKIASKVKAANCSTVMNAADIANSVLSELNNAEAALQRQKQASVSAYSQMNYC